MKRSLRRDRHRRTQRSAEQRLINSALRLIDKFQNTELTITSMINRTTTVLNKFAEDVTLEPYRLALGTANDALIVSAKRAIGTMHQASLMVFNPFLTSGFSPDEDEFSDALAELFSPCRGHGFKKVLLSSLLDAVAQKLSGTELATDIEGIAEALNRADPALIRVSRNYYHRDGKPDIVILGTDPSAQFIILIENKKPGGNETLTLKGYQTNRHYKILKHLAAKMLVDEHRTIAIFLTPAGLSANEKSFVALSTEELSRSMLKALDTVDTESDKRNFYLAAAWAMTYDWLNGGIP